MLDVSSAPGHTLEDVDSPACDQNSQYLTLYTTILDDPVSGPSTAYVNHAGPVDLKCTTGQELQDAMNLYAVCAYGGDFGAVEDRPRYPGSYQSRVATSDFLAPGTLGLEADVAQPQLYTVPTQSLDSDIYDTFFSPVVLSDRHIQLSDLFGPPKSVSNPSFSLQAHSYLEQCFYNFTSRGNANDSNPGGAQPKDQHTPSEPKPRRKPGRPKGLRNRPKDQCQTSIVPRKLGRPFESKTHRRCIACKQGNLRCNRNNPTTGAHVPCANCIYPKVKDCKMPRFDIGGAEGNKRKTQKSNVEKKRHASTDEDDEFPPPRSSFSFNESVKRSKKIYTVNRCESVQEYGNADPVCAQTIPRVRKQIHRKP